MMVELIFWSALSIIVYCYVGYGVMIGLIVHVQSCFGVAQQRLATIFPDVTLLIAAFNERSVLEEKIANIHSLNYPKEKLDVIFVTDGSTDGTDTFIKNHSKFRVLHNPKRKGKSDAINRAMKVVDSPIVVFSDANAMLNSDAIMHIVQPYHDPRTGAVSGEKRIGYADINKANGAGEGLYWKYESALKKWDSQLNTVVGAAGELFSIRRDLFEPIPEDTILDDFYISLRIVERGYRVAYVPDAYATEVPSASLEEEMKRKIRICAGGLQSIMRLPGMFNVFKRPLTVFQYVSHRVIRWTIAPLLLPVILISNLALVHYGQPYTSLLVLQSCFYMCAILGWFWRSTDLKRRWLFVPLYFLMMNLSAYLGFWRFFNREQSAAWVRAKRAQNQANVGFRD